GDGERVQPHDRLGRFGDVGLAAPRAHDLVVTFERRFAIARSQSRAGLLHRHLSPVRRRVQVPRDADPSEGDDRRGERGQLPRAREPAQRRVGAKLIARTVAPDPVGREREDGYEKEGEAIRGDIPAVLVVACAVEPDAATVEAKERWSALEW